MPPLHSGIKMAEGGVAAARVPSGVPPFTLGQLRAAIPAHCFKRDTLKSFAYLLKDVFICAALAFGALYIDSLPSPARWVLWPLYWFWQGAFATGIWVISHECGHGAFSDAQWINDAVGLVFHSLLLVPYYSWKHSHRRHHQNTGSVTKDEVFVPQVKPPGTQPHWILQTKAYRVAHLIVQQTLGWPLYLAFNTAGRAYDRWANHFDPYSPIFTKKERTEIIISDLALVTVLSGLGALWKAYGLLWLLKMYILPLLVVNHWLVMITFLQHTHPNLPHYDDKEWEWLRGALATVDRSYGFLDNIFHNITDTHVIHHLFSYMPHYHAKEATEAAKKVMGNYYAYDGRSVFAALWEGCGYAHVSPDAPGSGILWYTQPQDKTQ